MFFSLISCSKDDGGDSEPTGESCDAEFTLTTPDGTSVEMSECTSHDVSVDFAEFDGASLPQPHAIDFAFYGPGGESGNCWVYWSITGVCPEITEYSMNSELVRMTWNTSDCEIDDSARGEFEAVSGSSVFTKLSSQPESGIAEGDPMAFEASATVNVEAADGTRLTGTVVINETVDLSHVPLGVCAGSSGGDADGDGYVATEFGGDDCDDDNPTIGPHATEVCDDIDNDCDGEIDEDRMFTFYSDEDGDGWGDPEQVYQACSPEVGDVDNGGDCDDSNPNVNPDESDVCDEIDNDCDDIVDEDGKIAFYPDVDGDGFGSDSLPPEVFCEGFEPDGYVTDFTDCNDADASSNPEADEVCGDDADNDCDGEIDEEPDCS